jgi:hypothetical protein
MQEKFLMPTERNQTVEKNNTLFLLEMQVACWGMDHFSTFLRGQKFILYTDHKPLEKFGKVHTKMLSPEQIHEHLQF